MTRFLLNAANLVLTRTKREGLTVLSLALILVAAAPSVAVAACDISPKWNIHVIAEPGPVVVATDFSLDRIAKLARDAGSPGKSAPLGFYVGTVSHKVSVSFEASCPRTIQIQLEMQLLDRRIEIGQELQQHPCRFSAALRHYTKIARADEAGFAQYVSVTAATLRATPPPTVSIPADRSLDDASRVQIEQWVKMLVTQNLPSLDAARIAAQQAVNTPEEMTRLAQACTQRRLIHSLQKGLFWLIVIVSRAGAGGSGAGEIFVLW